MASKANGMVIVPEDGFDEGEFEQHPNWAVSKPCLKLASLRKETQKMKSCRSDSALVLCCSTMSSVRLSETEFDATTCGSNISTRESSVEDIGVNRKRCVTFGAAEDMEETKSEGIVVAISNIRTDYSSMHCDIADHRANSPAVLSFQNLEADDNAIRRNRIATDPSTPRMVNISSLTTDYSTMYRGRARTDSRCEDMFRMSSDRADQGALDADQPLKIESTFGSTVIVTTDYSPRRWRTQTEEDRIETKISSKTHSTSQATFQSTAEREEDTRCACRDVNHTKLKASAPATLCDATQAANVSDCLAHLKLEFQQLQEKQRALLEEKQRLLAAPRSCSVMAGWTMPTPSPPPGAWGRSTEPMRNNVGTNERCCARTKTHEKTTIIIQHLPKGFMRDDIVELLNFQGFAMKFDFIYAPVRFSTMDPVGYAFVNLVSPIAAEACRSKLDGFSEWGTACEDVLNVVWSESDQGLKAIIDRHRNSPVMHNSIQEEFKPAIYKDGLKISFPAPTKKIKKPKEAKERNRDASDDADKDS